MLSTLARLWRRHRLLTIAFAVAVAFTAVFAVRTGLSFVYWANHRDEPIAGHRERELVGVCVSLHNGCDYCVEHHRAGLARHLGGDASLAAALSQASRTGGPPLSDRERALCQYAGKLTRAPAEMRAADLEPLRAAGLDDAAILDLNQIVAYFAYANRTVLGLGVATAGEPLGLHPSEGSPGYQHQ